MKKKSIINLVGSVLVLAAIAVFASFQEKAISMGPAGMKCTLGKDGAPITCTWG